MSAKKLRLLLLKDCNRTCKGCCNNEWDLSELPICDTFDGYSTVILTGGEPLLVPEVIKSVVARVREENPKAPVIVYTAWREDPELLLDILQIVDGITLTLHTRKDTAPLETFSELVSKHELNKVKSLRLNVFRGVSTGTADLAGWDVRKGLAWIKECPLPQDEVFMRLRTAT